MDLRIISLNVNSIVEYRHKFLLENFIAKNHAHVYLLQETKFGPSHNFTFPSFSTFSAFHKFGCGKVDLLVHHGLRVRNLHQFSGLIDGIFLDIFINGSWIPTGSVYIHQACGDLGQLINYIGSRGQFLIGGDLNARHDSFGILSPPFPTCFHSANGSFIDKFIVCLQPSFTFSNIEVLSSFSDHAGISISIHCPALDLNVRNGFVLKQYNFFNTPKMNAFLERELDALNMPTS